MGKKLGNIALNKFYKEAKNPSIFYKNNFFIYNQKKGHFAYSNLTEKQKDVLSAIDNSKLVCCYKDRACGITSMLALYVARVLLYEYDKNISYLSPFYDTCEFKEMVIQILRQSDFFEENQLINKKMELRYGNSRLVLNSGSKNLMRGFRQDIVIFDEAIHIKNMKDMFMDISSAIFPIKNSKCIITSSFNEVSSNNVIKEIFNSCHTQEITFKRKLLLEKGFKDSRDIFDSSRFFKLAYSY